MKVLSISINVLFVALALAHKDLNGSYGNGDVDSSKGKDWGNRNDHYNKNVGNDRYSSSTTCTKSAQPIHTGGYNKPEVRDVHFSAENKHYDEKPIYKPSTTCTKSDQSVKGTSYTHPPIVIKPTTSCTKSTEYAQHTQITQHHTVIISKSNYEQVKPSHYIESKVLDSHSSKEYIQHNTVIKPTTSCTKGAESAQHTQITQHHTIIISKPNYEQVKPSHYSESKVLDSHLVKEITQHHTVIISKSSYEQVKPSHYSESKVSSNYGSKSTSCAESTTKAYVKETSFVTHQKPAYTESKGNVYDTHYNGNSNSKVSYTVPVVSYTAPVVSYSEHKVTHTIVSQKTYYKPSNSQSYEHSIKSSSSCTDKLSSNSKPTWTVPLNTVIYTALTRETPKNVLPTNSYSVPPAPIKNTWTQPAYPTAQNTYKPESVPTKPYVPTITPQVLAEHSSRQPPQPYIPSSATPSPVYTPSSVAPSPVYIPSSAIPSFVHTPTVVVTPAPTCITPPIVPVRPINRKCKVRYEVVMFTDCDDEDIHNLPLALPQPTKRAPYTNANNVANNNIAHNPINQIKPAPFVIQNYKGSNSGGEVKWQKAKDAHTPYANWHQTPNQGYGSGKSNNWDHVDYIGSHSY